MAGKVSFRLTPETRSLLREHAEFYAAPLGLHESGQSALILKAADPEARTELVPRANGDLEVTLVLPLDDNDEASDGRIYLKDRFVFDPTQKALKDYGRSFEYSGKGPAAAWQGLLRKYEALLPKAPRLSDSLVQDFGLAVARTYGQGMVDAREKTLPKLSAAFDREHRYLDGVEGLVQEAGRAQGIVPLRLRIKEKENFYQVLRRGEGKVELVFRFSVDTDGDGSNGRLWLKDRFFLQDGKFQSFARDWFLDPRPPGDPNYPVILENLKHRPHPPREELQAFAENLYPELVPQGNPHPEDLIPLLAAGVRAPQGESLLKHRGSGGPELRSVQKETLELIRLFAEEDLVKRAEEAQGLLNFGRSTEIRKEGLHWESLFTKLSTAVEESRGAPLDSPLLTRGLSVEEKESWKKILNRPFFREFRSLAQEKDGELRGKGLLHFAERLFAQGYSGTALAIAERLSEISTGQGRARKFLERVQGRGGFGSKVEFAFAHFHREIAKPSMILGMMAAPFAGVAFEAGGLRLARHLYDFRMLGRLGAGTRWGASLFGMLGESLAFTGVHRAYERLWHSSDTAWKDADKEIASAFLLFLGMRGAHAGGAWSRSRMAEGKWNVPKLGLRFGGRQGSAVYSPDLVRTTPAGRLMLSHPWVPEAGVGAPGLSFLGRAGGGLIQHFGGIGAIQASGWASRQLGLAPQLGQGFGGDFFDATVAYGQAMLGFRLANAVSGGRLQPALGEAKMRLGLVEPARLVPPNSPLARRGLFLPQIPEFRLFDLNRGGAMTDLRLTRDGELSLDPLLFGKEGSGVMLGRDREGPYLIDRRPRLAPSQDHLPANHVRLFNFEEQALLFNRNPLPLGTKQRLQEGDSLRLALSHLKIMLPRQSPIFESLARLSPAKQMRLGARLDAVVDVEGLIAALRKEDLDSVADHVREIWKGPSMLHSLPIELGLQGKVEVLIQAELRKGEREGLDELAVKMKPELFNPRWSPLEQSLHTNRAIQRLQGRLRSATSMYEASRIVQRFPFLEIEGKPVAEIARRMNEAASLHRGSLQELPYTAGIRQKARDIWERENYWAAVRHHGGSPEPIDSSMRADYQTLHQKLQAIYHQVRHSQDLRREAPNYTIGHLEELVYQVLERGQPLEILPEADGLRGKVSLYQYEAEKTACKLFLPEMEAKIDPWTGERVDPLNREARYRLALHVLNRGARRPVLGVPSTQEQQELTRLVRGHFDEHLGGDFLKAQGVLREHLDGATPQARKLLRRASPKEKALLLSLYFGPYRRRDLAPSTALQVATWMGQAGMLREVGVTYEIRHDALRSTLSLGNLGNVEPQHRDDFFALHTHPEGYLNPDGANMGYERRGGVHTINLADASISRSTLNILPSQVDLRLYFQKAQEYWRAGAPLKFGETPLFKVEGNRFRNWVIHSLGTSDVQVPLSAEGIPQRIEVRFGARRLARLLNGEYQNQKRALEAMSAEFGIPVVVEGADYRALMGEMPYGIRSLFDEAF